MLKSIEIKGLKFNPNISISFHSPFLDKKATVNLQKPACVLLDENGAGKSVVLRILAQSFDEDNFLNLREKFGFTQLNFDFGYDFLCKIYSKESKIYRDEIIKNGFPKQVLYINHEKSYFYSFLHGRRDKRFDFERFDLQVEAYEMAMGKCCNLINQYLYEKKVRYKKSNLPYNPLTLEIYRNETEDIIPFDELSLGEKRIIKLFSTLYLSSPDPKAVFIDDA